ncbi:MAG TPA: LPS export ABC transporter permease LptG, partial [Bacteroidetes bacterium]|nr:LPS export ABC transporter permease LptG [Bacteroidota bacterium]
RLDRYIARRFFQFFFFSLFAALAIYLVVDPIENLDKFLDKGVPKVEIFHYYLLYIPYILYVTFPVAVLLATMFCIGGLTNSNELMAMTASGVPLYRHLVSLGLIGLMLSAFAFWWGESVVPETNHQRLSIWRSKVQLKRDWRITEQGQVYLQDGPDRVLHLDVYQPKTKVGYGVDLFRFRAARVRERISARQMSWDGSGWVLKDAVIRTFSPEGERIRELDRTRIELDIRPEDMIELKVEPEEMGMTDLRAFVERLRKTGGRVNRWQVDIHSKVALPFAGFIIILFAVPVSAVRQRSGVIFGITLSLLISFIYFALMQTGKVLGYKEILPPLLAAWLGNLVFAALGLTLLVRVPK